MISPKKVILLLVWIIAIGLGLVTLGMLPYGLVPSFMTNTMVVLVVVLYLTSASVLSYTIVKET